MNYSRDVVLDLNESVPQKPKFSLFQEKINFLRIPDFLKSINFSCSKSNQTSFPELPHQHSTSICTTLYIGDVLPLKWEQHWQKAEILLILYFSTFEYKHTNGTSQLYKERTGDWLEIKVKKSLSRGWSIVIYHLWRSAFVILGMFVFMWWFFYLSVICLIVTEIR